MIRTKIYYGSPGLNFIQDSALAFVNVLSVARNQKVFRKISTTPTGSAINCQHLSSQGKILFSADTPFNGPTGPGRPDRELFERVYVKWKE